MCSIFLLCMAAATGCLAVFWLLVTLPKGWRSAATAAAACCICCCLICCCCFRPASSSCLLFLLLLTNHGVVSSCLPWSRHHERVEHQSRQWVRKPFLAKDRGQEGHRGFACFLAFFDSQLWVPGFDAGVGFVVKFLPLGENKRSSKRIQYSS